MLEKNSIQTEQTISFTEYRFDYFGEPVQWRIMQCQSENDFIFTIRCTHLVFKKHFPGEEAKLTTLFIKIKDSSMERSERMFFQNMIDSCDIA